MLPIEIAGENDGMGVWRSRTARAIRADEAAAERDLPESAESEDRAGVESVAGR